MCSSFEVRNTILSAGLRRSHGIMKAGATKWNTELVENRAVLT